MSIWDDPIADNVIELIRRRSRIGVKRYDPFLTLLLVAALRQQVRFVLVERL